MKKHRLFSLLLSFILFFGFASMVSPASAQTTRSFENNPICVQEGVLTIRGIECIVANILSIAISGIGFAGFVMMLVGSFQYLMSGGDTKGTQGGKNTITFAIVGLVVALSSWIILNFIATFTGIETIKIFKLCYGDMCG